MCMFSLPIPYVAGTSIFARSLADGGQVLVYSMSVEVSEDVAMVLPLPVSEPGIDEAIAFIDLSGYAGFFGDLNKAFPALMLETRSRGGGLAFAGHVQTLQVHDVGNFEASYVPSRKDFARLDRRFRLPDDVWSSLPQYDDFGFAVFKLKKPKRP